MLHFSKNKTLEYQEIMDHCNDLPKIPPLSYIPVYNQQTDLFQDNRLKILYNRLKSSKNVVSKGLTDVSDLIE